MSRFFDRDKPKEEPKEKPKGSCLPRNEVIIPASKLTINLVPLKKKTK